MSLNINMTNKKALEEKAQEFIELAKAHNKTPAREYFNQLNEIQQTYLKTSYPVWVKIAFFRG